MKLMTATTGTDEHDYNRGIVEGELVEPAEVCDRDMLRTDWPGACGCGRAFLGFSSRHITTAARITEIDITRAQVVEIVTAAHPDYDVEVLHLMAGDLIEYGTEHEVGTVVRIWRYELTVDA